MDEALAARRLSAALGRKVNPEDVLYSFEEFGAGWVRLHDGRSFRLAGGNAARDPAGKWWKNGKRWAVKDHDPNIRPLSEVAGTMTKSEPVQSSEWQLPYSEPPDDRTARHQAPVERAPDNDPEKGG